MRESKNMETIDALDVYYRKLNDSIDSAIKTDKNITLSGVFGQRYIGRGLSKGVKIKIQGTPGNDMAAYMDGAEIEVFGNAQDAVGNTMNAGRIVIHGRCGDTLGYSMRGGEIYVEGNVGYRVGIHMKEYKDMKPVIVAGGKAGDFLGEYMAGGAIILLGLDLAEGEEIIGRFCGTGIHGGKIYINGNPDKYNFGKEVEKVSLTDEDIAFLRNHVDLYAKFFKKDLSYLKLEAFAKYAAVNKNPYFNMYCSN
jgi:glutamate synthase domain-containing protein 3